jgi:MOSC domain-containing protein YiiM
MPGQVVEINLSFAHGVLPTPVGSARAVAGQGLEGDRYFAEAAEPGEALTLIEEEALAGLAAETGIELSPAASRRQLLTRGVRLNDFAGKRFLVGKVECVGVELCEPCNRLAQMTERGVLRGLVHRGGLRADILTGGEIAIGDEIRPL